jgi:hypothetical protein
MPQIPARQFNRAGKSQISIFNDQIIHHSCIASLRKSWPAGDDAIGHNGRQIICLEFWILVIGFYLRFGFWCLEFS